MNAQLNHRWYRASVFAIAVGVAATCHASAWAQASAEPSANPVQTAGQTASGAAPESGEIIVTAQKREQRLRDVPMSITAATGQQLRIAGVTATDDLGKITPGFTFQKTIYGLPIFFIRGIGFYDTTLGVSPAVTVYVDQQPIPFSPMSRGAVLDLERVEVLKGPQGTLFGQNSTGGAINFIAAKPTDSFHAGVTSTAGRFGQFDIEGYVSGPLADNLKVRLALRNETRGDWQDGYTVDEHIGQKRFFNGRFLADWDPASVLHFEFQATGWRDRSDTQQPQFVKYEPLVPLSAGGRPPEFPVTTISPAPNDNAAAAWDPEGHLRRNEWYYQVGLHTDLDVTKSIKLTSLTSYSKYKVALPSDMDGTIYPIDVSETNGKINSFSQELRLAGKIIDPIRFMIGASYQVDKVDEILNTQGADSADRVGGIDYTFFQYDNYQHAVTKGVFGSVDYQVTDALTAQASVRYSDQDRRFTGCSRDPGQGGIAAGFSALSSFITNTTQTILPGQCITLTDAGFPHPDPFTGKLDQDNVSYRFGLNWKVRPGTMLYANITKGYKAGSFPTTPAAFAAQLDPIGQESLLAYEVGAKTNLGSRYLEIETAAFYYDYRNKQIQGYKEIDPFGPLGALVSIPKSRVWGAEGSVTVTPLNGLRVALSGSYINTKVLRDPVNPTGAFGDTGSFVGDPFPYTPKWQGNADISYEKPISSSLKGFVGAAVSGRTATDTSLRTNNPEVAADEALLRVKGYALLDLRLGVEAADGRWRAELWGKNVTNKFYTISDTRFFDYVTRYTGMPATYGATVTFKY